MNDKEIETKDYFNDLKEYSYEQLKKWIVLRKNLAYKKLGCNLQHKFHGSH